MTRRRPRLPVLLLALLLASALGAPADVAHADPDQGDDWVAQAAGRVLTRGRLADAVLWRVRQELMEAGSGPNTILRQLVEEMIVEQEARRLGVGLTKADVDRKWNALDTEIRHRTGGAKNLMDLCREQGVSRGEFRDTIRQQLLKEAVATHPEHLGASLPRDERIRLAQIEVVIAELSKRAVVTYGIRTALQETPADLEPGVAALVNGEPLLLRTFGEALVQRLPADRIRRVLEEECKAVLTASVALSVEAMDAVIDRERERWHQRREMSTQEAMRSVSFADFIKMSYQLDLEDLKQDRYFRGLYGLVERFRQEVTEEEIRKEWLDHRDGLYGDAVLVTDIEIAFSSGSALVAGSGRDRREALRLAHEVQRRFHAGEDFDQLVNEINSRRDRTFFAKRLRVRNTDKDRLLYERAMEMEDGEVSGAFETLAEVHLMRRGHHVPAPPFEEVQEMIRDRLARQRAHTWLEEQLADPDVVRIRWPLPDPDAEAPAPGR